MSFQQGLSGLNAIEQEPGGDRQQHRQRQHLRRQGVARRVRRHLRQRAERRRRQRDRHRRQRSRRWRSSSRRATSSTTDNPMDLAINGAGFFQVTDGTSPAIVHAQRPVQGRPRRLHRQQPAAAPDGLPGRRDRRDPCPAQASAAADADRRHHAGGDDRRSSMEMNLDARAAVTAAGAPAPPIDFADPTTYNNATSLTVYDAQGPGRRADLLLPEGGDRHLERLRHRQRHADRDRGRQPGAVDDDHLPGQRRHADRAGRHRSRSTSRRSTNAAGAATRADHRRRRSTSPAPPSTARSSASPTCRRTATRRAS